MEHQQKKVKVNNVNLNLTFLVKFSICAILLIYLKETTPVKITVLSGNTLESNTLEKQCASRVGKV